MTEEKNNKLIDPTKAPGQLIKIECKNCSYIDLPKKWNIRTVFGVIYLLTILNIFSVIAYFAFTNPYICSKCGERGKLVKLLNNGDKREIGGLSKKQFIILNSILFIIGFILLINYY
ncbi:hypothetical protein KKF32_00545 [Patescibacteria group bacterium]|nr:hypothetical protein [Patescibacteria group bacterium]